jgi:hypothetical protein
MSNPSCARGDFVIEVRSLLETPGSIRSSYWIREVGNAERFCGGPFETFPDACSAALDLATRAGSRVWRESVIYLEDGTHSALQLVSPSCRTSLGRVGPVVRDCA